jgi:hypothetical protein
MGNWFQNWNSCAPVIVDPSGHVYGQVATLNCLLIVFVNLIRGLILFAGLTVVIMFIFAGYNVINSSGDPKKIEAAKNTFGFGLLGLSIIVFSFLIIAIISAVTGVTCITKFGFSC